MYNVDFVFLRLKSLVLLPNYRGLKSGSLGGAKVISLPQAGLQSYLAPKFTGVGYLPKSWDREMPGVKQEGASSQRRPGGT